MSRNEIKLFPWAPNTRQEELIQINLDGEYSPKIDKEKLKPFDTEEMLDRWTEDIADPDLRQAVGLVRSVRKLTIN